MAELTSALNQHELAAEEAVRFTSDLIRFDTSNRGGGDGHERPAAEYVAAALTDVGYDPVILEAAPGRTNVVLRVPGSEPQLPALLVHGHLDVVPADPAEWLVHPFSGEVRDGMVWGRGAVDMKNMDATVLAVLRAWAREGRGPRRDVVVAFTADEEDSATFGAGFLVRQHAELFEGCTEGISESGAFTFHAGGGVRLYPVAAGERGTAWVRLTARGRAGHGSKVNRENAVVRLAAAVTRIDEHRWPVRLSPTMRRAIVGIAAAVRADIDGLDLERDIDEVLDRLGPARSLVDATVRNTANPTGLSAGYKTNVIPGTATATVDGRVLPGTIDEFAQTMDQLAGEHVDWEFTHTGRPLEAPVDSPLFAAMRDALLAHDPGAHVVPFSMSGGTDAKQFARLGIVGYGFSPVQLPPGLDYYRMFHGVDERVPVSGLHFGVRVLDRFLSSVG